MVEKAGLRRGLISVAESLFRSHETLGSTPRIQNHTQTHKEKEKEGKEKKEREREILSKSGSSKLGVDRKRK